MPGKRSKPEPESQREQVRLLWGMGIGQEEIKCNTWEPRGQEVTDALLEILSTGAAIFIRPGSGGRAIGIAIWEGDTKWPATWCYDDEEINMWAASVLKRARPVEEAAD